MSSETPLSNEEQIVAAQMASAEAMLTVHQDTGNPGRVMFSLDLSGDGVDPEQVNSIPTCDLIAMTLFNVALRQGPEFVATYNAVAGCITEMLDAQENGADGGTLRAIRERHGIHFRVG